MANDSTTLPARARALNVKSNGATYSNWLRAVDMHLQGLTQGQVSGTYCSCFDFYDFRADYDADALPSQSASQCLQQMQGIGRC